MKKNLLLWSVSVCATLVLLAACEKHPASQVPGHGVHGAHGAHDEHHAEHDKPKATAEKPAAEATPVPQYYPSGQ